MKRRASCFLFILMITASLDGTCQQTVFALFSNDLKLADKYYKEKNFQGALQLYTNIARKDPSNKAIQLRVAQCYNSLKKYPQAIATYDHYLKEKQDLSLPDLYYYAEAQSATSNYNTAITYYRKCLAQDPDNELFIRKIWRLNNIKYLYEDSMHYAVRPVSFNTDFGELCPALYQNGIVFISNRKGVQVVEKVNASVNAPFYQIYFSKIIPDTTGNTGGVLRYGKALLFTKSLDSKFNSGPVAFYNKDQKMVFVSSANEAGVNGARTLQLHFAEMKKNGVWKITTSFPYNSDTYSISDPSISGDGKILYFSSDMKGGIGGKDLYKSELVNGQWTKPVNLGEAINTVEDEVFPYLYGNEMLYFSSNGHAGLGGLDIFKAAIKPDGFDEPKNAGYPLNTNYDDFGIIVDSLGTHGYFSSNRKKGGYNDDLFEFDMDLQTYPLTITGVIRYKEHTWSDSSELKILPNAKIYLIDNLQNASVHESTSDANGNFSIVIRYFSKYVIRVVGEDGDENMAILEIPKHRKGLSSYEIVLVKDVFKGHENQEMR